MLLDNWLRRNKSKSWNHARPSRANVDPGVIQPNFQMTFLKVIYTKIYSIFTVKFPNDRFHLHFTLCTLHFTLYVYTLRFLDSSFKI